MSDEVRLDASEWLDDVLSGIESEADKLQDLGMKFLAENAGVPPSEAGQKLAVVALYRVGEGIIRAMAMSVVGVERVLAVAAEDIARAQEGE